VVLGGFVPSSVDHQDVTTSSYVSVVVLTDNHSLVETFSSDRLDELNVFAAFSLN
jgi:hypothetical protein